MADNFDAIAMRLAVNNFDAEKLGKDLDLTDFYTGKI